MQSQSNSSSFVTHNDSQNDGPMDMGTSSDYMQICVTYVFIVEGVIMGIFCLFGFCGNTLSMLCLAKDKSKTATPFLLVSLEAADTLFLVTVLILRVFFSISIYFEFYNDHSFWAYAGKYIYPFAMITETGTIYVTLLVTLNRYVSVCKPYDASTMCSVPHARQHVLLVLAFAILYNIPRFLEYDITPVTNPMTNVTKLRAIESELLGNKIYQIIYVNIAYFLIMFLVPLFFLIFLNSNLIKALRETKRRRAQLLSGDAHSRSEEDITLILIVVVLVFVICQTPALFTQVLGNTLDQKVKDCHKIFFYYARISDLLVVGNSSLNFLIYCFCSKKFRQILKSLICKPASNSSVPVRISGGNIALSANTAKYKPVPTNAAENGVHVTKVENSNITRCCATVQTNDSKV